MIRGMFRVCFTKCICRIIFSEYFIKFNALPIYAQLLFMFYREEENAVPLFSQGLL